MPHRVARSTFLLEPPNNELAKQAARILSEIEQTERNPIDVLYEKSSQKLKVFVEQIVMATLAATARKQSVSVTAIDDDVSTQYAADFLNVSRPFVVKLCEQGKLPYRMVGTHRRIKVDDLCEYMEASQKQSEEAMQALMDQAQDLGLGY